MSDDTRPRIGHGIIGVIQGLQGAIKECAGLDSYMEPTPQRATRTSVLIIPRSLGFRSEGTERDGTHQTHTAILMMDLVLNGEGSGFEFLAEAVEASFTLGLFLESPITIEYGHNMYASFTAEETQSGRFFDNEDEGSGFHVYEQQWSAALFFPVLSEAGPGIRMINTDPMLTTNMGG